MLLIPKFCKKQKKMFLLLAFGGQILGIASFRLRRCREACGLYVGVASAPRERSTGITWSLHRPSASAAWTRYWHYLGVPRAAHWKCTGTQSALHGFCICASLTAPSHCMGIDVALGFHGMCAPGVSRRHCTGAPRAMHERGANY